MTLLFRHREPPNGDAENGGSAGPARPSATVRPISPARPVADRFPAPPPALPVPASERAAALHNLGVALEAQGTVPALLQARDRYTQALVLAHRRITADAIDRVAQRLDEARAVRAQRVRE